MDFEKHMWAYGLKNATEHGGKANQGAIINGLFNIGLEKKDIPSIIPKAQEILKLINALSPDEQNKKFKEYEELIGHRPQREGLGELDNVIPGKVKMRFAPSPSGPMHIGHIFTSLPSALFVKQYGGEMFLRIEDTNPENIYTPAYTMLQQEAEWLLGKVTTIIQSDRVKLYYSYVEKLIEKNAVYVCICKPDTFKVYMQKKQQCPCRKIASVEETKFNWEKMLDKKGFAPGDAVLRFASDVSHPNPAMRDFPLARINETEHPRQKHKFRVWPLMNLAVTVDDIELKLTHIIRGKDQKDNALRQQMMYGVLEADYPQTYFLGMYNFTDLKLSATQFRSDIENGTLSGWDDISLPTLATLKKRGFVKEAFEAVAIQRGVAEVDKVITKSDFFELLSNFNRDIIKESTKKFEREKANSKSANAHILHPNGKIEYAQLEKFPKLNETIFLSGIGYVTLKEKKKDNPAIFYFLHD